MKRIILLISVVLLATPFFGQQNKLDIGLEGSPSLIFLRGNGISKNYPTSTIGFSGGLFFQYNFQKTFSLRSNLSFERKGSIASSTIVADNGDLISVMSTHQNFDYLTVPALLSVNFGKKIKYFLNVGTFFGYLINQTTVYANTGSSQSIPNGNNTYLYKRFDMGAVAGFGISIPLKDKYAISCEIRNSLGLLNVNKVPSNTDEAIKTNSTNLLIGFTYKFKKLKSE